MGLSEDTQRPKDFNHKVEFLKKMEEFKPADYRKIINTILDLAEGYDDSGLKPKYYEGWQNADFEELLEALGETSHQ